MPRVVTGDIGGLCWECTRDQRRANPSSNDFVGLCSRAQNISVFCDGCNQVIWVDHRGRCVQRTGVRKPVLPPGMELAASPPRSTSRAS